MCNSDLTKNLHVPPGNHLDLYRCGMMLPSVIVLVQEL